MIFSALSPACSWPLLHARDTSVSHKVASLIKVWRGHVQCYSTKHEGSAVIKETRSALKTYGSQTPWACRASGSQMKERGLLHSQASVEDTANPRAVPRVWKGFSAGTPYLASALSLQVRKRVIVRLIGFLKSNASLVRLNAILIPVKSFGK